MRATQQKWWLPALVFCIALVAVPLLHMQGLRMAPGDIGDARLNNYFLENIYQYFAGGSPSLWHPAFFAPFRWIIGFSDNLFGSAPVYLIARAATGEADTAFQLWFIAGYAANFAAAYYALRRLGGSIIGSTFGALVFAFALPTTAHAGHAQLHYRFGAPLALAFFILFLEGRTFRHLIIAAGWTVWQLYCGIYTGFFTMLLLALTAVSQLLFNRISGGISVGATLRLFADSWRRQRRGDKALVLVSVALLIATLIVLFYPYLMVTRLYGASRPWAEIANMLPRLQSYILSDESMIWSARNFAPFERLPMRHEHQMFFGLVPWALAGVGLFYGWRTVDRRLFFMIAGMIAGTFVLTLSVNGWSLWYLLHFLPLASAIRAVTRVDQILLFPLAFFVMTGVDGMRGSLRRVPPWLPTLGIILLVAEFSLTSMPTSEKSEWRARLAARQAMMPASIEPGSILMFAQATGSPTADEIDSMWVSLRNGFATMNGYSGNVPPGASSKFGNRCSEIGDRLRGFMISDGHADTTDALEVLRRVVPIGFDDCETGLSAAIRKISQPGLSIKDEDLLRLPSNVGVIEDGLRRTDGRQGYLFFGPYLPVRAGAYRLRIEGHADDASAAMIDLASGLGGTVYLRLPISPLPEVGLLLDQVIDIPENVMALEIRLFVGETDELTVSGYELTAIDDTKTLP